MSRNRFFNKKSESLTLANIIEITGAQVDESINREQKICDVATLANAENNQISFLSSGQYSSQLPDSKAGFCLMEEKYVTKAPAGMVVLTHKNPYYAYSKVAAAFYEEKKPEFQTLIHPDAQIGQGTKIAPNAYIGKGVKIGKNCLIGPSASIMDGCIIGDNCIINASSVLSFVVMGDNCIIYNGAKIGQDGFGFAHDAGVNHKIIQLGIVELGNDVEVGANSCIDRGAIENTIIGDGTKLDNFIQIAHNVEIGKGCVMAGATVVAGSVKIGNCVQIGGNSSLAGHITVGDGVKVAGMSGVTRDVEPMQAVAGIPAVPIRMWHKMHSILLKMAKGKA